MLELPLSIGPAAYLYDVTGYRAIFLNPSKKAGIIMRYRPPAREFLRPGFVDHEGFFNGTFTRAFIFIVNTNLVAIQGLSKVDSRAPRTEVQGQAGDGQRVL